MLALMKADHDVNYKADARFTHSLQLLKLERGGMTFGINDLTENEWNWLAELKTAINKNEIKKAARR